MNEQPVAQGGSPRFRSDPVSRAAAPLVRAAGLPPTRLLLITTVAKLSQNRITCSQLASGSCGAGSPSFHLRPL